MTAVLCLFLTAFGLRLAYHNGSHAYDPLMKDAGEYFFTAYNLLHFGVWSHQRPSERNGPPLPDYRRPLGYPLFLVPFIPAEDAIPKAVLGITVFQAFLGSMTAVITFFLARLGLPFIPALAAGCITALSPHLIAAEFFLLSETLLAFLFSLAALLLAVALCRDRGIFTFMSGLVFGLAAMTHPIAVPLAAFVCLLLPVFMWKCAGLHFRKGAVRAISLGAGFVLMYGAYVLGAAALKGQPPPTPAQKAATIRSNAGLDDALWPYLICGADIKMTHFIKAFKHPELLDERDRMIRDRAYAITDLKNQFLSNPLAHIGWYLGGKILFMWRWEGVYTDSVYQYPMAHSGFETSRILGGVYDIMRALHWPLYGFTLLGAAFFLLKCFRGALSPNAFPLTPSCLIFVYYAGVLSLLIPLPRYAFPVRPFASILACYGIWRTFKTAQRLHRSTYRAPA